MPVEGMVPDLCRIVEKARFGWVTRCSLDDFFKAGAVKIGPLGQLVEIRDVRIVVFAIVKIKGVLRNVWGEAVSAVGKGGEVKGHYWAPCRFRIVAASRSIHMGGMATTTTLQGATSWTKLDQRIRRVDEARWLSSRYAALEQRRALIALYSFNYELARVRTVVSEPAVGAIRFQWWRDALEDLGRGTTRRHEVAEALDDAIVRGHLHLGGLRSLIDGYEAAFVARDRDLEPEAQLALQAVRVFASAHSWGEALMSLAPHWAGLRRGERLGFGPVVRRVPYPLRPAVAHFRLRRIYASGDVGYPIGMRICIFRAMLTGQV